LGFHSIGAATFHRQLMHCAQLKPGPFSARGRDGSGQAARLGRTLRRPGSCPGPVPACRPPARGALLLDRGHQPSVHGPAASGAREKLTARRLSVAPAARAVGLVDSRDRVRRSGGGHCLPLSRPVRADWPDGSPPRAATPSLSEPAVIIVWPELPAVCLCVVCCSPYVYLSASLTGWSWLTRRRPLRSRWRVR
jgi:hypothetical protein